MSVMLPSSSLMRASLTARGMLRPLTVSWVVLSRVGYPKRYSKEYQERVVPRQNSIGLYFHSFPTSTSRAIQVALNR
jgi:hypothetical protein